jgi:undecaprenyl-diphosphatase
VTAAHPEDTGGPFEEGLLDAHVVEPPHELGPVHRFDDAVDRALDRFRGTEPNDRIVYAISELADFSLLWHLIGWSRALADRDVDEGLNAALRLSATLGAESFLVNGLIKSVFKRERPVVQQERPHKLRVPLTTSFPSGHASSAFMAAVLLSERSRIKPVWFGLATAVAVSRVYVRIHHASDVVGGAATGLALGYAARRLWKLRR